MQLKVRARPGVMVPDYQRLFNGIKCFVGWTFDPNLGELVELPDFAAVQPDSKRMVRQGGFVRTESVVEVGVPDEEIGLEYARAMAEGDLEPGDDAAALYTIRRTGRPAKHKVAPAAVYPTPAPTPPTVEDPTPDTSASKAAKKKG